MFASHFLSNHTTCTRYYAKWAAALCNLAVEHRFVPLDVLKRHLDLGPPRDGQRSSEYRFEIGEQVWVRPETDGRAMWRRPHLRTPGYLHGCPGVVELHCGHFPDPEKVAFRDWFLGSVGGDAGAAVEGGGEDDFKQALYRVRFLQRDVWPEYEGSSGNGDDVVTAEVFDSWLQASPAHVGEEPFTPLSVHGEDAPEPHHHHHDHVHDHTHDHTRGDGGGTAGEPGVDAGEPHVHLARADVERTAVEREGDTGSAGEHVAVGLVAALQEAGCVTSEEIRALLETLDGMGHDLLGAHLVARAWVDPAFKERLLADGNQACLELGIGVGNPGATTKLTVVETVPGVRHCLVVCTLCSCYPLNLLGLSPDWYKSRSYRARAVREPRAVLREFGTEVSPGTAVQVNDSTADLRYLVLPPRPPGTEGWPEDKLRALVTRDSMIGVTLPKAP